jgi:radical SAM superfamily enzyme YgiQ (UPF0313 family)
MQALMRVTLIYPSMGGRIRAAQMQPLTMAALAGLTPKNVSLSFYDDRIEEVPYDEPTDLVGISVQVFTAKRAYEIAAEFRRRRVPVVLGGFHVTSMPEEAAEHADAIVIGESEDLWPGVIEDARRGQLQRVYQMGERPCLRGLNYRRDIFCSKHYLPVNLVEFGRGCPHDCSFCSVGVYFGHRKSCRPVSEVVEEIRGLPQGRILFADDNLIGDVGRAKELFRALIPLHVRWTAQAGVEITFDDELLRLATASGCEGLLVGFESLNEGNLRQMRKSATNGVLRFDEAIRKIHHQGIKICASFVFGCDHDTSETFESTLVFANEKKFLLAFFNHLTPYPGTPLYEELKSQNRLRHEKWWLSSGFRWGDVVFDPKNMSAETLSESCRLNRRKFYKFANILRRVSLGVNRRAILGSLALNFLVRREIREKQGFPLGHARS